MKRWQIGAAHSLLLAVVAAGCATPASQTTTDSLQRHPSTPKRITASIWGELVGIGFAEALVPAGKKDLDGMVAAGLTVLDPQGVRRPRLADRVPSIENGLWKLLADGGMETTWNLRPNTSWHDGAPLTADDFVFSAMVEQEKGTDLRPSPVYSNISRIEAPEPSTVRVTWNKPYLWGDSMFTVGEQPPYAQAGFPLPKHLLESPFSENKNLTTYPYWGADFVGTGPYKIRDWVRGSHVLLVANDQFVLGRPKIDEIDVQFIADQNVIVAGLLAGNLNLTMSRGFTPDQGALLQDQWGDGQVVFTLTNAILLYPQLLPPAPAEMGDARFRRALLYAVDRHQLGSSLMHGLSAVADDVYLLPGTADHAAIEPDVVRFSFDPQKAAQLWSEMGLTKGADGFLRDSSGQKPTVAIHANDSNIIQPPAMLSTADYWQRAGVATETVQKTVAEMLRDPEYLATRPAFYLARRPIGIADLRGTVIPTAENRYAGTNLARYQNAELDALIDRYNVTIPQAENRRILGQTVHLLTDQAVILGLFHDVVVMAGPKTLKNFTGSPGDGGQVWNAEQWELTN